MADIPNPDKPPDPLTANTSTSTVDVNELLQNPVPMDIAATLGLLDDPSSPFGGSSSLLLPPGMNTSGLVNPSTFQPTTTASQGGLTGGVPQTISTAEGPNLNIPDVSQLASSLIAAAAASLESSGSSVIEQPTHHEVDSSCPLNPPLIVPDISQFTTASAANSQPGDITATHTANSQPGDITATHTANSQPGDITATHTANSQPGDITATHTANSQPGDITATHTANSQPGDITATHTANSQPGNITATHTANSQPGDITATHTANSQHGDITVAHMANSQPGAITAINTANSEHGDITATHAANSQHGAITATHTANSQPGAITATHTANSHPKDSTATHTANNQHGDITATHMANSQPGAITATHPASSQPGAITATHAANSQPRNITATSSQLKDTSATSATSSQPGDISSQLKDTSAMSSQPPHITAAQTAGSQPGGAPKQLMDPSLKVSTHLSIPNISQLTTSSPSPLVSNESKGVPSPISQHVGGTLPQTVGTCQPLSTTGTGQLVPPSSARQGVLVKTPESSTAPSIGPSAGSLVSTSVQTTSFPSSAPITPLLPRHPDPPPTNVQPNTASVPISAATVGNLLASAIASSVTSLSSSSPSQAASPSPAAALESASIPKGLNLPLLQFLNLNFPNLRIESIKDILQVNAILATTLQLHEQHKASAALQTSSSSSSSVAAIPQLPEVKPKRTVSLLTPPPTAVKQQQPNPPSTSSSLGQTGAGAGKSRVFAQVIHPDSAKAAGSPVVIPKPSPSGRNPLQRSSPLILMKQNKTTSDLVVHTTLASIPPSTASPLTTSTRSTRSKFKQDLPSSRALLRNLQLPKELTRTIVQPADSEMMEVDVGQPLLSLNLPAHLKDHSYSLYNPEEGDRIVKARTAGIRITSTIPPARLSYAPQVPDSPTTLYKLLKVVPRKTAPRATPSSSSRIRNSTPRTQSRRGTPSSRNRKVRGGGGVSIKPGSQPESEESHASSSEHSDNEDEGSQLRRRSQRNVGQRKRYVDDFNISFSDEEPVEDVVPTASQLKRYYKGYGEEEDSEYEGVGGGGAAAAAMRSAKHKSRTISVNPTEGFRYSDVYFEPPAEEANLVERILSFRVRETKTDAEKNKYGDKIEEYLVKYKNYSYLHTEWATFDKLLAGDKKFDGKAKRYRTKVESMGIFAAVDDEPFNPEYTVVDRALDVASQTEANGEIVTHYLVKWRSLPYEDATWELEEDVDPEKIRKFNELQMVPPDDELEFVPRPPPASFKRLKENRQYKDGNLLRPYQLEGVNWLLFNWFTRQNCILADEMGLGKTVQSIAFLIEVFNAGIRGPFLVIAPLSTITNWQREFEAWSDLNLVVYHGSAYSRRLIHEYELYYRDTRGKIIPDAFKFNVIVTTYEVMLSDDSELQNIEWRLVIIDEAHRLKNRNCKLLEGLKTLDMEHRVLLTGTPLQNSVDELFSLLNFLEPQTFPSHLAFLQQFGKLKTEEQVEELKTILKPMMLRRLKEDVEKSIAPKEETIIEVELTAIQKQYYRAILERNFTFLSKGGSANMVPSLLNVMMELRKCCNHPFLITGAEHQIVQDFQVRHPDQPLYNALIQASGKLVLIDKLLPKLKENGHKVLIFSQMVRCLDILEDYLRLNRYLYERIDGQVTGILRQGAIDRFSKPDSDRFVFLLCTRAGGLGINLTAADTVIIYDSDWNPQNDIQAQARCHRIGQNKAVKVYRLITRNSYEREMFDRASLKLGLDKAILQSMNTQSTTGPPQLTKKEIEDLLKKGAYGAIMEEDDDANKFCEEDIEQILERRAHVIQLDSEGKDSTFSKASFVADGSSDINIDDPDFWQKWAEKAKLDLEELATKDSLVIDTPRQRRQVRRYGNENLEEIVDMSEVIDEVMDILPARGRRGWTKLECIKTEKAMLIYGWGQWREIVRAAKFKKRQLGMKDVENIARTMLVYCLAHFTGDDKVPPYIHHLIDPSEVTERSADGTAVSVFSNFTEDDYLALRMKNPETLFQDETYMKHLRRHANKILLRVRQLHIIRWGILTPHVNKIMKGVPTKSLGLDLPKPEDPPPALWWNLECDHSLIVGILKHGYEQFGLMRSDPALCFRAIVGEEPLNARKKKKVKVMPRSGEGGGGEGGGGGGGRDEDDEEEEMSGMESEGEEGESGPSTPSTDVTILPNKRTRSSATNTPLRPGQLVWPSLADVNTRARRLVSAWLKQQKREEQKQAQLQKERERKEREAEVSRKKEQKKAELAQKWSKREEQDFIRVISFFGVVFDPKTNKYDWTKFRHLASLGKKSDERLTLYLHDFKQMCWRVLKKKRVRKGLSGIRVEPVTEERASRCLQRIDLLSAVREEILPHPEFDDLIKLCELSFEVPHWWIPGDHDRDLLRGVAKHGLYRSDQLIYNDLELSFKETVPQTALFDPNSNQVVEEEEEDSGSDGDGEGPKLRSSAPMNSNPVPLGWPKEKAIVIRMTRIVYAFRHRVWPKPMEGLDLFTPMVDEGGSSSGSSESEDETDSEYEAPDSKSRSVRKGKGLKIHISTKASEDSFVDVEGDASEKDFEIEKQQGLKLTFKKSTHLTSTKSKSAKATPAKSRDNEEPEKLEIKIPRVKLSFASKSGLKRIPKKRPADRDAIGSDSPEAKKQKSSGSPSLSSSSKATIVDPAKLSFTDLSGHERVGVINRNTREKALPAWERGYSYPAMNSTTASTEAVTLTEEPPTVAGGPSTLQCRPNMGVSGD